MEQLEAKDNYQEGPLVEPNELNIMGPTSSKRSIFSYWKVLNSRFLGVRYFFSEWG